MVNAALGKQLLVRPEPLRADLSGACLCGADLEDADLQDANLSNANLGVSGIGTSVRLEGANLREALLAGTILARALYDASTVFPEGFDPAASGMITREQFIDPFDGPVPD